MESITSQSQEVFEKLKRDPFNNKCIECRMDLPMWASVNHGILICKQCADIHKTLGSHISFIRSIELDTWNHTLLSMMLVGGNKKFVDFMSIYGLNDEEIQDKYTTVAADFYRRQLNSLAKNEEFDENIPRINEGCKYLPVNKGKLQPGDYPGDFGQDDNKIKKAFVNFGAKVKNSAKNFSEKPKVKEMTEKTQNFFGKIGGKIKEIAKKTKESETYQKVKEKSKLAYSSMANTAKKTIEKMKSKEDNKEENKEDRV